MNGVSVPFAIMLYTTYMYEYKYVATLYCTYKKSFLFVLFIFIPVLKWFIIY